MNICVIGTGYVGLVTGTCFAYLGRSVTCCDIDNKKIKSLSAGKITFFEPGLEEKLKESLEKKNISFSSDIESVCRESDVIFIAVGTPSNNDGSADLSNVFNVAEAIGNSICDNTIVVIKSTVPVGTTHKVERIISEKISDGIIPKTAATPKPINPEINLNFGDQKRNSISEITHRPIERPNISRFIPRREPKNHLTIA